MESGIITSKIYVLPDLSQNCPKESFKSSNLTAENNLKTINSLKYFQNSISKNKNIFKNV